MPWVIDPFHTLVEFSTVHLAISTVKGHFKEVRGTIFLDMRQPELSSVKAQINAASIDTGTLARDSHLRSIDFLEVAKYPQITFTSTSVRRTGAKTGVVTGDMTLHGITCPVSFQTELVGFVQDPETEGWRVGFFAACVIDRRQFKIVFNPLGKANIPLIANEIRVELHIEAVQM